MVKGVRQRQDRALASRMDKSKSFLEKARDFTYFVVCAVVLYW